MTEVIRFPLNNDLMTVSLSDADQVSSQRISRQDRATTVPECSVGHVGNRAPSNENIGTFPTTNGAEATVEVLSLYVRTLFI